MACAGPPAVLLLAAASASVLSSRTCDVHRKLWDARIQGDLGAKARAKRSAGGSSTTL
jgi:hypothetical protein